MIEIKYERFNFISCSHEIIEKPFRLDDFIISNEYSSLYKRSFHAIKKEGKQKLFITMYYDLYEVRINHIINYAIKIPQQISNLPGFVHLLDYQIRLKKSKHDDDDDYDDDIGKLFLITAEELMKNGTLSDYLADHSWCKKNYTRFDDSTVKSQIIFGIAASMKRLHSMEFAFGSLCLRTIFLDDSFEPRIRFAPPKCIGTCNLKPIYENYFLFSPPELLNQDSDDFNSFDISKAADVYSYGMILYSLFSGGYKPGLKIIKNQIKNGWRPDKPRNISDEFWELIQRCWSQYPDDRPSFDQIVSLLRDDRYVFDSKTDLDSLHKYQDRLDPPNREQQIESLQAEVKRLTNEISNLKKDVKKDDKKDVKKTVEKTREIIILVDEDMERMTTVKRLGKGGSAIVEEVAKAEPYALKTLDPEGLTVSQLKRLLREYELLNCLLHPNIIKVFGFFYGSSTRGPSILLELCPKCLAKEVVKKSLSNIDIVCLIYEIVEAMKFVHSKGVIHRDLKPTNILIDANGHAKVADFGIAKIISVETQTSNVGTQKFMAPELLNEVERYDEKVDVYSFGVLLFWCLTGGKMPKVTLVEIGTGKMAKIPESVNKFASNMIKSCWSFDPKQRPSFEKISISLKKNKFKLFDLKDSEVSQVIKFVKNHDEEINKAIA